MFSTMPIDEIPLIEPHLKFLSTTAFKNEGFRICGLVKELHFIYLCRNCKKFGRQSWLLIAIVVTELLVAIKFDPETISRPLPMHIKYFWIVGCAGRFVILKYSTISLILCHTIPIVNDPSEKCFEKILGIGENAGNQHFLLFPQFF